MKRRCPHVVLLVALALAACGRGEPTEVARANATDSTATTVALADDTTTTAPPTMVVPTTLAPPTTAAPVTTPTTLGPFSVRDISVTMKDCRHGFPPQGGAGSTYGCLGTFVVRLNSGTAGQLKWKATWDVAIACEQPRNTDYPAPATEGSLDVAAGATEVTGKLAMFSENDFNPRLVAGGAPATLVSKITVSITEGGTGSSAPTPFYGDGDCTKPGTYTSPSYGTAVEYP